MKNARLMRIAKDINTQNKSGVPVYIETSNLVAGDPIATVKALSENTTLDIIANLSTPTIYNLLIIALSSIKEEAYIYN